MKLNLLRMVKNVNNLIYLIDMYYLIHFLYKKIRMGPPKSTMVWCAHTMWLSKNDYQNEEKKHSVKCLRKQILKLQKEILNSCWLKNCLISAVSTILKLE